ncbi:unnamed protein product [Paramecium octaurelia]|uniref:Uncharacterized protein n=1 Tax=Paramecium octaurelia TaxID=43137 RepID=A0A8S1T3X4_PAROT|nr:unnamed protein product [Paramecium octaurelia]CAD8146250.1 unnamed protein product [Paramecium octaurelia]
MGFHMNLGELRFCFISLLIHEESIVIFIYLRLEMLCVQNHPIIKYIFNFLRIIAKPTNLELFKQLIVISIVFCDQKCNCVYFPDHLFN